MTFLESLSEAFRTQAIVRVAIVDDGYDAPSLDHLLDANRREFVAKVDDLAEDMADDEEEDSAGGVAELCRDAGLGELSTLATRLEDPEHLAVMWEAYQSAVAGNPLHDLLHELFRGFATERADKRAVLLRLEELIKEASQIEPDKFGSDANGRDMVDYDLIFLDFYLEPPAPEGQDPGTVGASWDKSRKFLTDLMEVSPLRVPLVMVISSEAKAGQIPDFRRTTKVLASALQFMPKNHFESDRTRAEAGLLSLVERRAEVKGLLDMLEHWKNGVQAASGKLLDAVRELEPSDYAYLRIYRLREEKVPLSHYLVDLFNGYLSDQVEQGLNAARCNALVDGLALSANNSSRVAPTAAISDLYAAVTTSSVRLATDTFNPPAWAGDIFLRMDLWQKAMEQEVTKDGISDAMPEVFAVVTPACDLIPERSEKLKTVTTICGSLQPVKTLTKPSTHFLTVGDKGRYHVEWNPKWPMTVPLDAMNGETALDGKYRWVGRLRDLYHADLQQTLTRDVGRIGLPVVPTMPDPVPLKVFLRRGAGYENVVNFNLEERAAWIFFNTKDKSERSLHLREDVIWQIREKGLAIVGDPSASKDAKRASELFANRRFLEALQNPIVIKKDVTEPDDLSCRFLRTPSNFDPGNVPKCDKTLLILYGDAPTNVKETVRVQEAAV